jgi:protein arginine N-methyltransferase 2
MTAPTAKIDDSMPARISSDCPDDIREVLYHAWGHDRSGLKALLRTTGKANAQDIKTGETPLHAAIRACGPASPEDDSADQEEDGCVEEAKEIIQDLFLNGAIWNDVDSNNETPGCVALRLGRKTLYNLCVEAGVRAELLFALMGGDYEQLSSGSEDGDEMHIDENEDEVPQLVSTEEAVAAPEEAKFVPPDAKEKPVTSEEYLSSKLTYDDAKLVDSDLNGVMMAWETDIMRRSVAALVPDSAPGKRILNIGFGMGIIDGMFADLKPSRHHIIEAHPSVLEHLAQPGSKFGPEWEKSGPEEGAFKVHKGKWQDVVPKLLEDGEVYDAIYFDTFGEDYSQLRHFFTECIIGIMDQEGRFSFFNGLGADRKICYDVYTKVVEMQCADAGLDVDWEESDVDMAGLDQAGKGEWEGVRRRYWTLDSKTPNHLFLRVMLTLFPRIPIARLYIHGLDAQAQRDKEGLNCDTLFGSPQAIPLSLFVLPFMYTSISVLPVPLTIDTHPRL